MRVQAEKLRKIKDTTLILISDLKRQIMEIETQENEAIREVRTSSTLNHWPLLVQMYDRVISISIMKFRLKNKYSEVHRCINKNIYSSIW